jgi:hypothetical protein
VEITAAGVQAQHGDMGVPRHVAQMATLRALRSDVLYCQKKSWRIGVGELRVGGL